MPNEERRKKPRPPGAPVFCWRSGKVSAEELPGGKAWLMRFHESLDEIPPSISSCVIATADAEGRTAEVKSWSGLRGPHGTDRRALADFCQWRGFDEAFWWRYVEGREPKRVLLYKRFSQ